jgi:hypothetical protein
VGILLRETLPLPELREDSDRFRTEVGAFGEAQSFVKAAQPWLVVGD